MMRGNNLSYRILGPTTVHLEHEICLILTTTFLTAASLISLYSSSFGTRGDYTYLVLTSLWLSRHLLHRIICTTDIGTSLSPWYSNLRWLYMIMTTGGQYFDVPSSIFARSVSYRQYKSLGGVDSEIIANDVSGGIASSSTVHPVALHRLWIVQTSLLPPVAFLWAILTLLKSKFTSGTMVGFDDGYWTTATSSTATSSSAKDHHGGSSHKNKHHHSHSSSDSNRQDTDDEEDKTFRQIYNQCKTKINRKLDIWWRYLPPLQLLVLLASLAGIAWFIRQYVIVRNSYKISLRMGLSKAAHVDSHMGIGGGGGSGSSRIFRSSIFLWT